VSGVRLNARARVKCVSEMEKVSMCVSESNRTTKQNTAQRKKKKHLQRKIGGASACFPRSSSCHGTPWHDHTILRSDGDVKAHATYNANRKAAYARESTLFNVARVLSCLVLSCLVSLECTLWEGFFWRMPKQMLGWCRM